MKSAWWYRAIRTRRHTYYAAATPWPGILLFTLIGLLGIAALLVAVWHGLTQGEFARRDAVLSGIGVLCVALSVFQVRSLARQFD